MPDYSITQTRHENVKTWTINCIKLKLRVCFTSLAAVVGLEDEQKSAADVCAECRSREGLVPLSQAVGGRTEICCGRTRTDFLPVHENSILFNEERKEFGFLDFARSASFCCFPRGMSA